jgi:magnesium transporter
VNQVFRTPGTIALRDDAQPTIINVLGYSPEKYLSETPHSVAEFERFMNRWPVLWVDVQGLADAEEIQHITRLFQIHDLWLADIYANRTTAQFEGSTGFVSFPVHVTATTSSVIGVFLGPKSLVTLHDDPLPLLGEIRAAIRDEQGQLRAEGTNYLVYVLLEGLMQRLRTNVEAAEEQLFELKQQLLDGTTSPTLYEIDAAKENLYRLKFHFARMVFASHTVHDWPMFDIEAMRPRMKHLHDQIGELHQRIQEHVVLSYNDLWDLYRIRTAASEPPYVKYLLYLLAIFLPLILLALILT